MVRIFNKFVLTSLAGFLAIALCVASAPAQTISISTSRGNVRFTAVAPTIFCVSASPVGSPATPLRSIFLDPAFKPDNAAHLSSDAGHQQLTTSAGTLDVDPHTGVVSLRDAHGSILIPPAEILSPDKKSLDLHIGWPANQRFDIYGCGDGANALIQHKVASHVGNRVAVEPFFWSPAGYATFVVGDDDNAPAQCDGKVDNGAVTWRVPGTSANLYLIIAPKLEDATRGLLMLTGRPPVPPRWTLGYLQSRWGWADKAYIDDTLHQFQSRHLPVDAFIFDFEWYTTTPDYSLPPQGAPDFPDFGTNPKLFPDLAAQIAQLHEAGVHFVGIRKPRLGNEQTLKMARANGWGFGGASSGTDARALLFADPAVRAWYAQHLEPLLRDGIDGWWNDEGEFTYSNYSYWNQAEQTALTAVRPTSRLWTINRAFSPGLSRFGAAAWTGDISGTWPVLKSQPTVLLNWSMAGMPDCGCDIGGYRGNAETEVVVRWMQAGTFFPVMRAHSRRTDKPHFPWLYGPDAEAAIRKALDLRYQLVPILYSLAHLTYETGEPMMRPLVAQYPTDPKVADLSTEWLLGHDLLAAPVLEPGGHRTTYLPNDIWYDYATGQRIPGGQQLDQTVPFDSIPLYVRGGSILTLAPVLQHTRDLPGGPLEVNVYPGRDGQFTLVEDDGTTTDYQSGNLRKTDFVWHDADHKLSWTQTGPYDGKDCFRSLSLTVHDGIHRDPIEQPLSATGEITVAQ